MQKELSEDPRVEVGVVPHWREVMDIRQASQYLRVSPDTLCRYLADKKIPAFKLGNRLSWAIGGASRKARWIVGWNSKAR